jgi:hypothetical protein
MYSVMAESFRVGGDQIARDPLFRRYLIVIHSLLLRSKLGEDLPPRSPVLLFSVALARD